MTFGDVVTRVVSEITLEPEMQVREVLELSFEMAERQEAFSHEISEADAARIYDELCQDPSEILSLYAAGKANLSRY